MAATLPDVTRSEESVPVAEGGQPTSAVLISAEFHSQPDLKHRSASNQA
jgi:hypothetical protein